MPLAGRLFFKWIKQPLRVEAFYGATDNAVKTQMWIAVSVYLLVAKVTQPRSKPVQHSPAPECCAFRENLDPTGLSQPPKAKQKK